MKKTALLLACLASFSLVFGQLNTTLLGKYTYNDDLSDVWGYTDNLGNEYAIVGLHNGTSILDVTNPSNITQKYYVAGQNSIWRDMKVWGNYAYITTEASDGLLIIDMTQAALGTFSHTWWDGGSLGFSSAHNIYIDENGIGYLMGCADVSGASIANGGCILIDCNSTPTNPSILGYYDAAYVHDCFVRGDTLWTAEINAGRFGVIDVSNKANPVPLTNYTTSPGNFCHNVWLSKDGNYLFTTDEISSGVIGSYDVSDLSNIIELDQAQSNPGSGVIPHNAIVVDEFVLISYYADGLVIFDAHQPNNLILTGEYDTSPLYSGNGFNGAWGIYPYLPSGNILISDIEEGLYVLGASYTQACYLQGNVTDSLSTFPLGNVQVDLVSTNISANSTITGDYNTGTANAGTYNVTFSKPGYISKTITGVSLANGVTTTLDVELKPLTSFTLMGQVVDSMSGNGIPNAVVLIENSDLSFDITTDANGNFQIPTFFDGNYDVFGGRWGYRTKGVNSNINQGSGSVLIELNPGYYDDYILDFGWQVIGNAQTGDWERGEPNGTYQGGGFPSEVNPEYDVAGDFGDRCYVTGNGGGGIGDDDVDDGNTILRSPSMDLECMNDPYISYYRWFINFGGSGNPDDELEVRLSNGINSVVIETVDANTPQDGEWVRKSYRILDYLQLTDNMRITFETADQQNSGHIVEAAVDLLEVTENDPLGNSLPMAVNDAGSVNNGDTLELNVLTNDPQDANPNATVSLLNAPSYGSASISTDGSLTYIPNTGGEIDTLYYQVCVDACPDHCSDAMVVINIGEETGIEDLLAAGFSVYPNPFGERIIINTQGSFTNLNVYNAIGLLIYNDETPNDYESINTTDWPSGIYYIELIDDETASHTLKMIKPN